MAKKSSKKKASKKKASAKKKKAAPAKKTAGASNAVKQAFKKLINDQAYYLKLNPAKRNYFRQLRARFKRNELRGDTMEAMLKKHGKRK
jgi:hypothetical protein